MKMLEEGNEDTIAAVNDLSEDIRKELDVLSTVTVSRETKAC